MGLLSGNSCNIITILPLGLDCDSINASTPQSTNGLIALFVTGGTAPYNVTWDNGSQGTLLTNLSPGSYTATVVDYYGDFTATTTCTVGYDSFYLEVLEDCKTPGNLIYYLADLVNPLSGGSVYQLTTQIGCWTSSGTTLYTGQTYIGNFPIVSDGPFTGCTECLPAPTPTPVYPNDLCLQLTQGTSITQFNFSSGSTINGYPSWTSNTQTIYYNTGTTQWNVSGWTYPGGLYYVSPTIPPTGYWTLTGPLSYGSTVYVSSGICQTPPLTMIVNKTNPTCSTTSNGSISITPNGGLSPYLYSIDSVNYQVSNTFVGLASGTYTVYVKDANLTVVSQTVILTPQQLFQNYNVSLSLTPGSNVTVGDTTTKTSNWSINVSPYPLPAGTVINMDLVFNVNTTAYTLTSPIITYTNNITTSQSGGFTISAGSTSTPVGSTVVSPLCEGGSRNFSSYTTTYNVQLSGSGTISGTIVQYINTPCVRFKACNLYALIKDSVNIQNITITPTLCKSVNTSTQPQQVMLEKTGLICPIITHIG
jgi:hypothetical protein